MLKVNFVIKSVKYSSIDTYKNENEYTIYFIYYFTMVILIHLYKYFVNFIFKKVIICYSSKMQKSENLIHLINIFYNKIYVK